MPEVEVITQKKLELIDEFICGRRRAESQQRLPPPSPELSSPEPEVEEYDMNATRALPSPAEPPAAVELELEQDAGETTQAEHEAPLITTDVVDEEADFLNLKVDAMSVAQSKAEICSVYPTSGGLRNWSILSRVVHRGDGDGGETVV